jgi:hypothetical protein
MTKTSLNPDQRRLVEIIEALGFGVIERLSIRDGLPCFEPEPCIAQAINLDSTPEQQPSCRHADLTLKIEFERLFNQFDELQEGIVDIEVRHGVPFRLVLKRRHKDLRRGSIADVSDCKRGEGR